jgi:hypothetical protein
VSSGYWDRPNESFVDAYRFYRQQLQLLQWQCSDDHWVLKTSVHLFQLEALLEVFPDACIVQTHRDLAKVLPSTCSLVAIGHSVMSQEVDPHRLGRHCLEMGSRMLERMWAWRDQVDHERVLDLQYSHRMQDAVGTIHGIYEKFGYTPHAETEVKIRRWLADHPRHKHGVHKYSANHFGLRAEDLERISQLYSERLQVPKEV